MRKLSAKDKLLTLVMGALVIGFPSTALTQEPKKEPNAKATGVIRFPDKQADAQPNPTPSETKPQATGVIQLPKNETEATPQPATATETKPQPTGNVKLGSAPLATPGDLVEPPVKPQSTGQIKFGGGDVTPVNQGTVTLSGNPNATTLDDEQTVVVIFKDVPGEKTLEKIKAILKRELYVITDDPAAETYLETKPWE